MQEANMRGLFMLKRLMKESQEVSGGKAEAEQP